MSVIAVPGLKDPGINVPTSMPFLSVPAIFANRSRRRLTAGF